MRSSSSGRTRPPRPRPPSRRFSSTVSSVMTPRPSGTWAIPRPGISSGAVRVSSRPSYVALPDCARTSPVMVRSSVVLPAPLAPSTAVTSPRGAVKETSLRARTAPYDVESSLTSSIGDRVAEVGGLHGRVVAHVGRAARRDDLAEVEDHEVVADRHDEVHVVLDEHHGHPVGQAAEQGAELLHLGGGRPTNRQ